jgi:hypothetical protein
MGRMDFPGPVHDAVATISGGFSSPRFASGQVETAATAHGQADALERPSLSWESAWIDLGGEG